MNLFRVAQSYLRPGILVILFFGLTSGVPLALIISTLKAVLFDQGFSIGTIGFLSLVSLPYSLKFLWAPIIDSLSIPYLTKKLGRRRSWIILAQLLLVVFIAFLGLFSAKGDIFWITIFAFLVAFTSATQDIAIDAYRIESFKIEDQGIASSMYVYGYRIGLLISGAGALVMSDLTSWDNVYYSMSSIMVVGMLITLITKENRSLFKDKAGNFRDWFKSSVIDPIVEFTRRRNWYMVLGFVVCFKLGDVFAGTLTVPFLMDLEFSKTEIASIVKTFGLFATLFGVFIGGFLVKLIKLNRALWVAGLLQMFSNLAFCYQSFAGHDPNSLYFVVFIENFSGGIGDVVFIAYLSGLCNVAFTATQYAILVSFATMGRGLLSSSAGVFVSSLGWSNFFLLSALMAIPGLVLLFLLSRGNSFQYKNSKIV